jgi:hypothetical protein
MGRCTGVSPDLSFSLFSIFHVHAFCPLDILIYSFLYFLALFLDGHQQVKYVLNMLKGIQTNTPPVQYAGLRTQRQWIMCLKTPCTKITVVYTIFVFLRNYLMMAFLGRNTW